MEVHYHYEWEGNKSLLPKIFDLGMAFRFFPRNNNPEVVQFQIFVLPLQLN